MYLSRVEIDLNNRQKTKDLSHLGAIHNWVEQSFPEELDEEMRTRKLWRIDEISRRKYLLVVSSTKPDFQVMERYGVKGSAQTKFYDTFLDSLEEGMRVRFRVTLNPTKSISDRSKGRGRVVPHVTVEQQMKYLLDRSEKNGFNLSEEDFSIVDRGYELFKKSGQKTISLSRATYEGILTIKDIVLFRKILTEGFGKKKAYGFGMMTVIPQ